MSVWRASVLLYVCRRFFVLFFTGAVAPVRISDGSLSWHYSDNQFLKNHRGNEEDTGTFACTDGTGYCLIPVACMILTGVSGQAAYEDVLLDFLFYSLFTPVCTTMMNRVMFASEQLMAAKSAVNRIEEVLHEQSLPELAHSWKPKDASVAFENVSFCYPGTEEKALDHVTFEIPEGKTVALVEASGSGKSTAAKLIPRFYDVTEGSVRVGGVDVREIDKQTFMEQMKRWNIFIRW